MPGIIDTIGNLSKLVVQRLSWEAQQFTSDIISNGIADGIQKSSGRLISIGISIALMGTGFFLALWGIATIIDTFFATRGSGYVLVGILAAIAGALVYRR